MEPEALCPLCSKMWPADQIQEHAWSCQGAIVEHLPAVFPVHSVPYQEDSTLSCFICKGTDASNLYFLESCAHCACKKCFVAFIMDKVSKKKPSNLLCGFPECGKALEEMDIRDLLTPDQYEEWQSSTLAEFVNEKKDEMIRCPSCSTISERDRSQQSNASQQRSALTLQQKMDPEAKEHYNTCRFRCRNCDKEFCSECSEIPYHLGYTCAAYKSYKDSARCRFCNAQLLESNRAPPLNFPSTLYDVCKEKECLERRGSSCIRLQDCGHACGGVITDGTHEHLPCLHCNSSADDFCGICWSESLASAPAIKLECSHIFHYKCITDTLSRRWPGATITFGFMQCPVCKAQMSHPALKDILQPNLDLYEDIKSKASARFNHMKWQDAPQLKDQTSPFFNNPVKYAMARACYYPCFKCNKPYFGGLKECNVEQQVADSINKADLVCGSCSAVGSGAQSSCTKHGTDFIEYKCKFCCNVAAWFCWGNTHFCEECHKKAGEVAKIPRDKLPPCTCHSIHPPNGEEYCLGCSVCRFEDF